MAIDFTNFQQVFTWVIAHGYWIIFLVMCVEGPMTTAAAGFAAALGYFNPGLILLISVLGDLIPDSIYYSIGYFGRGPAIEKFVSYFGLTEKRVLRIEDSLKKHFGKTMVALKLTPVVPTMGFMLVGYLRLSFIKFTEFSAAVTIPKSIIFLAAGYYFGRLYNINQYLHDIGVLLPVLGISVVVLYFGYKKISEIIASKVEKI
jgi:membrane protein DedA with SNARE-associated domain